MEKKSVLSAVEIYDLTVAYDQKPVLWDIDLTIPRGKLTAVVGPNGAGKTTLLKAMLGLLQPVSGAVKFPVVHGHEANKTKNLIGYVPQSESVDWDFPATVLDVVMMGSYGKLGWLRRPGRTERELAMQMLDKVKMTEFSRRQISQLSGGQQQRVFLARALMQEADIYFMDEPFKGVDAQTEKSLIELLKEMRDEQKTVVAVHHDLQTVSEYFDWVTLINLKIIASGPVASVFTPSNIDNTYRNKKLIFQEA